MMFAALALALLQADTSQALPPSIVRQLPQGYEMRHSAHAVFGTPAHDIYIVALGRPGEKVFSQTQAQPRPLLIYELRSGTYMLAARNDHVVLQADEGGQCDPFEGGGITAKGAWFTVENSVACGNHWTDYITFRFDARLGYVFDNQRFESWSFNPSNAPDAEALISDGMHVTRAVKGHLIRFADWRDSDS